MEDWMMPFKNPGNSRQATITFTQWRNRRNCEMFPRNQRQRQGCQQAKNLRDQNNAFSTEPVRQMTGGQRQRHDRHGNNQANQPKRGRGMSARIHFPFHGHREHQTAGDRKDITNCEQTEIPKPERRIRIMRRRHQIEWGKVGPFRGKWITSSRRENCKLSASISTWSSGKTSAGDSCALLKKLMAAATASSCRAPGSMTLRRRLLKF